ncbi:MAG: hypothetical protein AAGA54_03265 [Myxococcota bacterium]
MIAFAVAATLLTAVPPPSAWLSTQPSSDEIRAEAAAAFEAGEAAFARGDYGEAVAKFSIAQERMPHPSTAYNLGLAQARAGAPIEAWRTFEALRTDADAPAMRADAQRQLDLLADDVARLRVSAPPAASPTLDGTPIEPNAIVLRRPGPAVVAVGGRTVRLTLRGGELLHLDLQDPPGTPRRTHRAAGPGLLAATVATAAAATGTGVAAIVWRDAEAGTPLAWSAVGLGTATTALASTALALRLRARRAERRSAS